ncbi:MAG: hypothetical protein LQ338_005491 [Usnochroma carphineum]|nr:MAG: hypothetical protein LQ338_005491 [Usnochroma carphineum]
MSAQTLLAPIAPPHFSFASRDVCSKDLGESRSVVHGPSDPYKASRGGFSYTGCASAMQTETGPQPLLTSLAPSMSNGGNTGGTQGSAGSEVETKRLPRPSAGSTVQQHSQNSSISSQLFRRDSASTAESSPTTTVSTMDSALTDPSPSSSPESATSLLPMPSFKSLSTTSIATISTPESAGSPASPFGNLPGVYRADSPNKKMRNTKNLSVNTTATTRQIPQLPKLSLRTNPDGSSNHAFSAPPTPSFVVPPKPPRKRPSNLGLSITTPDSGASSQASDSTIQAVPPTPADPQQRTIRYLQTASTMPMISSPTMAPEGGMRLPPFGNPSGLIRMNKGRPPLSLSRHSSIDSQASPIRPQMLEHVQEEPDYDLPLSRETKSPAYPQGPVCIYDPNVYLYLEPSGTEASEFDVVLNVAREVKNPFEKIMASKLDVTSEDPLEVNSKAFVYRDSISEPPSAIEATLSSASDNKPEEGPRSASSTPKAMKPNPEYIHIPWDHNTQVVDDLLRLCELIDRRVQDGKRVLVHCQCGVSRSASLVVAYGLYKNPQLSVQEAYDAVKNRSKWIGPNMNLIYQLNEFRGKLPKNLGLNSFLGPQFTKWQGWKKADGDSTASRPPLSHRNSHHEPLVNTSKKEHELTPVRANSLSPSGSAQFGQTSASDAVSPGPSSAPPDMQWSPSKDADGSREQGAMNEEPEEMPDTAIRIEDGSQAGEETAEAKPALDTTQPQAAGITSPHSSHEASTMSTAPLPLPGGFSSIPARKHVPRPLPFRQLPEQAEVTRHVIDDVPKTPSLLSPRAVEFTASPFHRTVAGDLAGSSVFEQTLMSPTRSASAQNGEADPRSPVQKGEAPITRSIFDVL